MKPILLLAVGFSLMIMGCGKGQKRKTNYSLSNTCKDRSLSVRGGKCVRESDQCPSDRINPDQTCKQVPCSSGLYFDGTYCLASSDVRVPTSLVATSFIDMCLGTLSNDQKYTFSAIFNLTEKNQDLEDLSQVSQEVRCGAAFGKLSQVKTNSLVIPFGELRDLTPLAAFDDLPDIKRIILDVSTSSTMTCPLQDPARCIFKAW